MSFTDSISALLQKTKQNINLSLKTSDTNETHS